MSQITDILLNSLAIPDVDTVYTQPITETHRQWAEQIEQAITDLLNEAIGEDERVDFASTLNLNIDFHDDEAEARNQLRQDIRTKLGITTKEMN